MRRCGGWAALGTGRRAAGQQPAAAAAAAAAWHFGSPPTSLLQLNAFGQSTDQASSSSKWAAAPIHLVACCCRQTRVLAARHGVNQTIAGIASKFQQPKKAFWAQFATARLAFHGGKPTSQRGPVHRALHIDRQAIRRRGRRQCG